MKTLVLSEREVRSILTMELTFPAVERAFDAHGRGETIMPAKVYLDLPRYNGDFRAMPAYFKGSAGVKWVNAHPKNPEKHGLPTVMALYILNDPDTALPLAVMDATLITAFRTGAAAGVASKYLARKDAKTIGFVGCGVQARTALAAHRLVFKSLEILGADVREEAARKFAEETGGRAVPEKEAAGCDIVVTTTPSRKPVVKRSWVKPGAHINAMGADAEGKQELDPKILKDAKIVIDDVDQACHSGEINVPLHKKQIKKSDIHAMLGQVVCGKKKGRTSAKNITVFDSTGLAVQDVAVAQMLYKTAREKGLGHDIEIISRNP